MSEDKYEYRYSCDYCHAKPEIPGPHHASNCRNYKSYMDLDCEGAKAECRFCGAVPFVAGSHHKESCKRYIKFNPFDYSSRMSTSEMKDLLRRGEKFMDIKQRNIDNIDWWTGAGSDRI